METILDLHTAKVEFKIVEEHDTKRPHLPDWWSVGRGFVIAVDTDA